MSTSTDLAPLDRGLLKAVSRSFYLSMRFLPAGMRRPVSLAYLLARATDTVADASTRRAADRLRLLDDLQPVLAGAPAGALYDDLAALSGELEHKGEQTLLRRLREAVAALNNSDPSDQESTRRVLDRIIRGQTLDLARFPDRSEIRALPDAAALDDYTWLVAGCVGEFWTDTMLRHSPRSVRVPADELREWGILFGKGLQLVNILRDLPGDLREGRCYLPHDELRAAGLPGGPVQWPENDGAWRPFHEVRRGWLLRARAGLEAGFRYARSVRGFRQRFTVLLPALIGRRTLDLLAAQPDTGAPAAAKISRPLVKRLMLSAARQALTGVR